MIDRWTRKNSNWLDNFLLRFHGLKSPLSYPHVGEMVLLEFSVWIDTIGLLGYDGCPPTYSLEIFVSPLFLGRSIEVVRAVVTNYTIINAFLELSERTRTEFGVQHKDIWNMDETGIALGLCANSQLLASSSKKKVYVKSTQNRI